VSDGRARKASTYQLKPTAAPERMLAETVWRCRTLSHTTLEPRIAAYRRGDVTLTAHQQHAELPDRKAALPEYAAIHRQVLQDVLTRLDQT
jgi:hypothetical protein